MADDAKVEDGDKGRLRKILKQLRKERDEENEARSLLEEKQQNLDEAHAKASETEQRLYLELEEYMFSWDREFGRTTEPHRETWQMMQSNNTMSQNLETDFAEILERTHQLEWNGTAKAIRVLELIKANVRSSLTMESVAALVAEWISRGELIRQIEGMAGQGDLVRDREPGVGRHDRRVDRVFLRRRQQSCLVNVNVLDLP